MSVLIIGGKGLVGIQASRRFLREGYPVVIYDLYPDDVSDFFDGMPQPVDVQGDLGDLDHLRRVIDQYQVKGVIHAALAFGAADSLKDPPRSFAGTVEGVLRILEAARTKKLRLVCVSTQAVYGPTDPLLAVKEDSPLNPFSLYPCWKAMTDLMCLTYQRVFQVDLAVIRTAHVYGPVCGPHRRKRLDLPEDWLRKALAKEAIEMPDGADHLMDWTYAEDVAQGIFLVYTVRPLKHRIFNISQGRNVPLQEMAQAVMSLVPGSSIRLGPGPSEMLTKTFVPMRGPADITLARQELGFEPQFPVQKGMGDLLNWIKRKGEKDEKRKAFGEEKR
jgi:nucleoside-diphosphate-sugar epimerase